MEDVLLQRVESADAFRFWKSEVLTTMNQQLRGGPFMNKVGWAVSIA